MLTSVAHPAGPKIGVLLKGKSDFWASVEKGAREAGDKLGAELIVKMPLSESDVAVQIRMLNAFAGQGIDALVIAPGNKDSLAGPVAAAGRPRREDPRVVMVVVVMAMWWWRQAKKAVKKKKAMKKK